MRNFSDLNLDFSGGIDPTAAGAKRFLKSTTAQMLNTFDRSIDRWMLPPQEARIADELVGRSRAARNCLGSNLQLRLEVGYRLIDLLHKMQTEAPQRRFFLVTLLSDRWLSFDRHANIWLGGMKDAMRQVMRLGGFDGWFGLVEVQTLDETVRMLGRILLPHGHFIAWSDNPSFCPDDAEMRMGASKRLESRTIAKTVDVRRDWSTSVCNMAAYIMKAACLAKRRVPSSTSPSGFVLGDSALPPVSAVRQVEILSLTTFDELMLSGGNGSDLRRELIRVMSNRPHYRLPQEVDVEEAARFWRRVRSRRKNDSYHPVEIHRSSAQLAPNPPISLACDRAPRSEWLRSWLITSLRPEHPWILSYIKQLTGKKVTGDNSTSSLTA